MRNLKKELRDRLLADKKEKIELRRELAKEDKDSPRAIEIRKLLGISTLKDMLGDKYPKRICKHCGKRGYTDVDLQEFKYSATGKYNRANCCNDCNTLLSVYPIGTIVGPYCLLVEQQSCEVCGRNNNSIGSRSWFLRYAKVCKHCLGTHEEMFGHPLELTNPIPLEYQGVPFHTYIELSLLLDIPYKKARYLLITNQLKDITWMT